MNLKKKYLINKFNEYFTSIQDKSSIEKHFESLESKYSDLLKKQHAIFQFIAKQNQNLAKTKKPKKPKRLIKKKNEEEIEDDFEWDPIDDDNDEI